MSVVYYLTTLAIVICWVKSSHGSELSRCLSIRPTLPVTMKQPQDISECSSDAKFKAQINHNYEIMFDALSKRSCSCNRDDINEFTVLLQEMKTKILRIVDSYFQCGRNDPTVAIDDAIAAYDLIRARFRSYGRNSFNKLSPKCNSVIQYVRRLPYISAENTIMSMVTCVTLKRQGN